MIFNVSGGGGTALNFRVVGGTTAPSNPKENMIWVNTSTPITDWVFSATQPTSASGRVWIFTGTSSSVEFNALKKNGIQVYPISAKQYIGGAWVDKTAKVYQDGQWNELVNKFYLFKAGEGALVSLKTYKEANSSIAVGTDAIVINYSGSISYVTRLRTEETYDLTRYSKLCMTYTSSKVLSEKYALLGVTETAFASADGSVSFAAQASVTVSNDDKTVSVDLRSINKKMYCGFSLAGTYNITEMWLE